MIWDGQMKEMDLELLQDLQRSEKAGIHIKLWATLEPCNPFAASSSFSHQFLGLKTLTQNSF